MRLYRAMRTRDIHQGITSLQPQGFHHLVDTALLLDAMYSHEVPTHALHRNQLLFSWSASFEVAKKFLFGELGDGTYSAIAYLDVSFDLSCFPRNLSSEILFAHPLFLRENWIDFLILREHGHKLNHQKNSNGHDGCLFLEMKNINYKSSNHPLFLSNLLTARNASYALASRTFEYVLIMNKASFSILTPHDLDTYKDPNVGRESEYYTGITNLLLRKAQESPDLRNTIAYVTSSLSRDLEHFQKSQLIREDDYVAIRGIIQDYERAIA